MLPILLHKLSMLSTISVKRKILISAFFVSLSLLNIACSISKKHPAESLDISESQRKDINHKIDVFNDNVLSHIIEIRDYRFRKVERLFCTHSIVEIIKEKNPSRIINVTAKLTCAESSNTSSSSAKDKPRNDTDQSSNDTGFYSDLTNLSAFPVKYFMVESDNEMFNVNSFQLPRPNPFYLRDIDLYFTEEELERINATVLDNKVIGQKLRKKFESFSQDKDSK